MLHQLFSKIFAIQHFKVKVYLLRSLTLVNSVQLSRLVLVGHV